MFVLASYYRFVWYLQKYSLRYDRHAGVGCIGIDVLLLHKLIHSSAHPQLNSNASTRSV
jgi:hypothetical protein